MNKSELRAFAAKAGMVYTEIPEPSEQLDMSDPKVVKRMKEVVTNMTVVPDRISLLNDFTVGGMVRMLTGRDLGHEGVVCSARDRIYSLSLQNQRSNQLLLQYLCNELCDVWFFKPKTFEDGHTIDRRFFTLYGENLNFVHTRSSKRNPHTDKFHGILTETELNFTQFLALLKDEEYEQDSSRLLGDFISPETTTLTLRVVDSETRIATDREIGIEF